MHHAGSQSPCVRLVVALVWSSFPFAGQPLERKSAFRVFCDRNETEALCDVERVRVHVRLDGHLLPFLRTISPKYRTLLRKGYGGLWSYVIFIGQKTRLR